MIEFFTTDKNIKQYTHHTIFQTFESALIEMANGKELWVNNGSDNMNKFKEYCKKFMVNYTFQYSAL